MVSCDVVIIGAGPAGSTLAWSLASAGLAVQVLERTDGPVFRVGESLLPEGIRLCHRMGLAQALAAGPFQPKHGVRLVACADGTVDRFAFAAARRAERGALAYQVRRRDFDGLLQRHAEAAGAVIRWGCPAVAVDFGSEREIAVQLAGGERIAARFLADASGQAHLVARQLGLREPLPGTRKVALFAHYTGVPRLPGDAAGDDSILWADDSWFWLVPFADGSASVGVVGEPAVVQAAGATDQERFDNLCGRPGAQRELLADRRQVEPVRRQVDYSFACRAKIGDRFLLLGDAAGFIDPVFSTGVFLAQAGAFQAAAVIQSALAAGGVADPASRRAYENRLGVAARRYRALVRAFYDGALLAEVARARREPERHRALTSILAGDIFDDDNPLLQSGFAAD